MQTSPPAPPPVPPLTAEEIGRIDALLEAVDPEASMTVEELDGFLAGLACCVDPVPQEEWLPVVLGMDDGASPAQAEAKAGPALLKLVGRHRASVLAQLNEAHDYAPLLSYDEDGKVSGNAWAIGFVRAMALRPDAWNLLEDDESLVGILDPVYRLVEEVEPDPDDPEASAQPIPDEERDAAIDAMVDAVLDVHEVLRPAREKALGPTSPVRRDGPRVGRNDACPCGSGRKYKACHGRDG